MLKKYRTILAQAEAEIVEKKSRFIATVRPVKTEDEAHAFIEEMKKKYWNATHNVFAYQIGERNELQRFSDDGEPQGTAGMPVLSVLKGEDIKDTAIVVTRYFGGIKLGTGGLIVAYKAAAAEALDVAEVVEKTVDLTLDVFFEYPMMNDVMRIVKEEEPMVVEQDFQMDCRLRLSIRASRMPRLRERYEQLALETGRIRLGDADEAAGLS